MRNSPQLVLVLASATVLAQVPSSSTDVPVCAIAGQGYNDPLVTSVNGGMGLADATQCQSRCASQSNCSVFTFYSNSRSCWLQGSGLTAEAMPGAISGPRHCDYAPAPVAAATTSLVIQQTHYLRFIEAPGETILEPKWLYFQDGNRIHLVRTQALCFACQSACSVKTEVTRAYIASLEQAEDFDCKLLRTTTTQAVGVYISDKKETLHEKVLREREELQHEREAAKEAAQDASSSFWPWILALALLLCCCLFCITHFDNEQNRRDKRRVAKEKHFRREHQEGLPLMAARNNQSPLSSTTSTAQGGPGAMPTQAQFNATMPTSPAFTGTQMPTQAQFNVNTSGGTFAA